MERILPLNVEDADCFDWSLIVETDFSVFQIHESREKVEAQDLSGMIAILDRLRSDTYLLLFCQEKVEILIDGYAHYHRELYEIPEARTYFKELARKWPYLFYFLSTERTVLKTIASCICDGERVERGSSVDRGKLADFMEQQFRGFNRLFAEYDLDQMDPNLNEAIGKRVIRHLTGDGVSRLLDTVH